MSEETVVRKKRRGRPRKVADAPVPPQALQREKDAQEYHRKQAEKKNLTHYYIVKNNKILKQIPITEDGVVVRLHSQYAGRADRDKKFLDLVKSKGLYKAT